MRRKSARALPVSGAWREACGRASLWRGQELLDDAVFQAVERDHGKAALGFEDSHRASRPRSNSPSSSFTWMRSA